MKPKPRNQHRTGLFRGHHGVAPVAHRAVRMTIRVYDALQATGAVIEQIDGTIYSVTLGDQRLPGGIVAQLHPRSGTTLLRMADEPDWWEYMTGVYEDHWVQADWTPCPKCGARLVWYEAGYVPGYRVCARAPHHHWIV